MDINNNQQQNTFESGMNTDTADYVLAKNQYREARNMRLVTDDSGNSAELHIIEGNKLIDTYKIYYSQFVREYNPNDFKILATNTVRNIGVIVVSNKMINVWNILKLTLNEDGSLDSEWIFGENTGISEMLSGDAVDTVLRWESSNRIKLYIADSSHYMLAINIAKTYTDPKIEDFLIYPNANLKAPRFVEITSSGSLTSGLYQYAYQRYNVGGVASEMSRTTKMIPLVLSTSDGWYAGAEAGKTTSGAITIQIPGDSDCMLTCVKVYRIRYSENGQIPTIELFTERELQSAADDIIVTDTGQAASATLTVEEFNSQSGIHIIPKCIESKHDYLFAAGISEQVGDLSEIVDFDTRTYSFEYDDFFKESSCTLDGSDVDKTYPGTDKQTAFKDDATVDTVKQCIQNLSKISQIDDCVQPESCKYAPWVYSKSDGTQEWVSVYGGVGPNVRWRFTKIKLDADYTPALTSGEQKEWIRTSDLSLFKSLKDSNVEKYGYDSDTCPGIYGVTRDLTFKYNEDEIIGSDLGLIRKKTSEQLTGGCESKKHHEMSAHDGVIGRSFIFAPHVNIDETKKISLYDTDDSWTDAYVAAKSNKNKYGDDKNHDAFNYGNPKMTYLFKSLRRGETYRFGLVFYDKYGVASKVKWMQDIRVPELYEDGFETFISNATSYSDHSIDLAVFPIGIEVEITGELPEGIVGYEVVRCRRELGNIKNIMQGVLARPIHRSSTLSTGADSSSSRYYTTGYLTTARWNSSIRQNGYWEQGFIGDGGGCTSDNLGNASGSNFDNFDTYQFVSAETTYQQESTQQMIDSIGEGNLQLDGLKMLFGQNASKPQAYAKNSSTAYISEAASIEMGHYNSYKWVQPRWQNSYYRSPVYSGMYPFCGRGLDVIDEGQQTIHFTASFPLWYHCMSYVNEQWTADFVTHAYTRRYSGFCAAWPGYYNYKNKQLTLCTFDNRTLIPNCDTESRGPASFVSNTEPYCMQYIKLYEQSRSVTYRTPCKENVVNNQEKYSLGHIVDLYMHRDNNNNQIPFYVDNKKEIDTGTLRDFTKIFSARPQDIHATIQYAFTPTTINKGELYKETSGVNNIYLNENNVSNHKDTEFLNTNHVFCGSGDNYIPYTKLANGYNKLVGTHSLNCGCGDNPSILSWAYEVVSGGPCLILKTTETAEDAIKGPTFSNISAALSIDSVKSRDQLSYMPPQIRTQKATWCNDGTHTQPNDFYNGNDVTLHDKWVEYTGTQGQSEKIKSGWSSKEGPSSSGSITNDMYGTYNAQRVSQIPSSGGIDDINKLGTLTAIYNHSIMGTLLCNISKQYVVGSGDSQIDKQNDVYYSYGDCVDLSSGNRKCVCFDGDCYIQLLEYVSGHKVINDLNKLPTKYNDDEQVAYWTTTPQTRSTVYAIPLETNIDIEHEYGHSVSRSFADGDNQATVCSPQLQPYTDGVSEAQKTQSEALYEYNGAYSTVNTARIFSPYSIADRDTNIDDFDYRCFYSNPKENGETVDSWTKFMSSNFIDVDTRHGAINKLKLFGDRLLFWQDNAFGMFDVNETAVVTSEDNRSLILGESGVLQRFTYLSTIHGIDALSLAVTTSDSSLYWFDKSSNVIMSYDNNGLRELSNIANVRAYVNNNWRGTEKTQRNVITLGYDKKYGEVLFNIFNNETLVYNENQQCFTGVYDNKLSDTIHYLPFNNGLLTAIRPDIAFVSTAAQPPLIGIYRENVVGGSNDKHLLYSKLLNPKVTFVVNQTPITPKVYDITTFGGSFTDYTGITLAYNTPHAQSSKATGENITRREWDYRVAIPRHNNADYGSRMRDKTIQCTISGGTNQTEFSLEYVITKYRLSCS